MEHQGWNPISVGSPGWLGHEQEVCRHRPRPRWQRPHTHAGLTHTLSDTDGGESVVGGLQTPVSGPHNGTASFANPTLSPTSELYKLKGTTDSSYCMKSLGRIFLVDQTSSKVPTGSTECPQSSRNPESRSYSTFKQLISPYFWQLASRKVLRACRVFGGMVATFMWGWMHIMRSHIVSPTGWTSNVSEWKLLHQGGNTRAMGALNVGQMEWPLTCWAEAWVKCEQLN